MKISRTFTLAVFLACTIAANGFAVACQQTPAPKLDKDDPAATTEGNVKTADGKIRFSFQEQEWQDMIEWFADQAGYSLQPITDWPEGTFTLTDDKEYTVLEALDQLNHALLIKKPDPYTLVRNGKMLVLTRLEDANFPDELIETVKVEDLEKRGFYETISVIFDLGELNAEDMFEELQPMIGETNRKFFAVFPAANQIHIRETGGQLRDIRDLIEKSRERLFGDQGEMIVYRLQHQDAETFMMIARPFLNMDEGSNRSQDESLVITPEPFGDRLYVRGTKKMLASFETVASKIDSAADSGEGDVAIDAPFLKSYSVFTDSEHAFNVLSTMLEGRDDVKMDLDTVTGFITILGRAVDHKMAVDTLTAISDSDAGGFAILPLTNGDPAEIIVVLQSLFRQTIDDSSNGPVLMANSELNHIIVRGTPQEVAMVKKMVADLDENSIPVNPGPRTTHRLIPMDQKEQDQLVPMLPDLFQLSGRQNRLNIILPQERKDIRSRLKNPDALNGDSPLDLGPPTTPESSSRDSRTRSPLKSSQLKSTLQNSSFLVAQSFGIHPMLLSGFVTQDEVGDTSGDSTRKLKSQDYQPPEQVVSIPGSPIQAKFTEYGLVLDSDDLDALDDLEDMIYNQLGEEGNVQLPTFFFLKHRQANQMMAFIESYYGMSDGGGGGGGGGNLMTGMMNNMMGGAGDLLGGLLGGAGGGSSGGVLEGEVRFGVDMPFNALYVAGATANDLDEISVLIDTLDQPEAPHDPQLLGQTRTIDIIHRDPTEVKEIVEKQFADVINSGEAAQGGAKQSNEAAQMMKMMQQLSGGGKKGGSSADLEQEKPKVRLGVDNATKQLLVTGPEFIYKDILNLVLELDKEELSRPLTAEILEFGNSAAIKRTLLALYGDKIEIVDPDSAENGTSGDSSRSNPASSKAASSKQAQSQQDAARNAMMQAIQRAQSSQRGGGPTATRGGGSAPTRGGGGSSRGGRGGR